MGTKSVMSFLIVLLLLWFVLVAGVWWYWYPETKLVESTREPKTQRSPQSAVQSTAKPETVEAPTTPIAFAQTHQQMQEIPKEVTETEGPLGSANPFSNIVTAPGPGVQTGDQQESHDAGQPTFPWDTITGSSSSATAALTGTENTVTVDPSMVKPTYDPANPRTTLAEKDYTLVNDSGHIYLKAMIEIPPESKIYINYTDERGSTLVITGQVLGSRDVLMGTNTTISQFTSKPLTVWYQVPA
jgi:hypothetical protein